ncbi:MAG: UbiA family prenyltransferase [Planctomycetia bacterium]
MVATFLAWLRLLRIPNHATAVADVLAGFLVCSGPRPLDWPPAACWLAIAASLCFYASGMVLNDVFDVEADRDERPDRPLPSGEIQAATASRVGHALLMLGAIVASATAFVARAPGPAPVGVALTAAVWLYDRRAKATAWGPVLMGGCRSLNWLLGMTAAGGPHGAHEWLVPVGMGLFVAGITLFARDEAGRSRSGILTLATLVMAAGLVVAGAYPWIASQIGTADHWNVGGPWLTPGRISTWLLLWGILGCSVLARNIMAIADPAPGRVQGAVGNAIRSIITLDAAIVLAACGEPWAIVVLFLLGLFLLGRRLASPT